MQNTSKKQDWMRMKKLILKERKLKKKGKWLEANHFGYNVTIPRIPIIPEGYPFKFKRVQFPVKLSFVMTIGQTLKHCGLYLENECFSHGQFYVGVSRVGSQKNLKIYAPENKTVNIVYQEILQDWMDTPSSHCCCLLWIGEYLLHDWRNMKYICLLYNLIIIRSRFSVNRHLEF